MSKHTVIIGGGGVGSSIAYFLSAMANAGDRITVVERDPSYRIASSSLSASSIRQQFTTPVNVSLSQFGWEFLSSCSDGTRPGSEVGLNSRGYLFVARDDQKDMLKRRADANRSQGVLLEELDGASLAARFPWMRTDDLSYASLGTAGEGWFDGYMLQQLYRKRARAAGVEYVHGDVVGLATRGDQIVAVELADGHSIAADEVVNAGGAWSASIGELVGVGLPVRARRRTMFMVSCPTPIPDFPVLIDASAVFVRPEQDHFLCTVTPEEALDHDDLPLDPDFTLFEEIIWPTIAHRIPAFEALRVERAWSGYYEYNTLDHNGLVGQIGPGNFFVATGFSGHGLMHSAGTGRGVAELLTFGEYRSIDLSPLTPRRIADGNLIVEDSIY